MREKSADRPKLIEYRHITVSQNGRVVLKDISLSIEPGEHVLILGPNGAGKSFLIKTITRENYPVFGVPGASMRIMGKESWNVFELRSLLGIVSDSLLTPSAGLSTGRQIVLSGFFSSSGIWSGHHQVTPEMEAKAAEVLELLEISHLADRLFRELSTGEARRLLISRALVHDPRALVLDEPSSSLDFRAARELRDILRKIAAAGTGIIMVTHDLADAIPEISRVIMLREGAVYKDGAKDEVLTSANLSGLFGIPIEVGRRDGGYYLK